MKKIYIYMFETSPIFEIVIASYILNTKFEICVLSDNIKINSSEGICINSNKLINNLIDDDFLGLIVCGGEIDKIRDKDKILSLIKEVNDKNKFVGAICSGREIVNEALNSSFKIQEKIHFVKENILFSSANNYIKFGIEIGKYFNIYEDERDYLETINFFENKEDYESK